MFSGPFLGRLADHYGRRRLSLVCCCFFICACLLKESSNFYILMLSSVVGGASTSLLFSAFESWMVAEHNQMVSYQKKKVLAHCRAHTHSSFSVSPNYPHFVCILHSFPPLVNPITQGFPSEWLGLTYVLASVCNSAVAVGAGIVAYLVADCCGHHREQRVCFAS